jgi:hypothetical protein
MVQLQIICFLGGVGMLSLGQRFSRPISSGMYVNLGVALISAAAVLSIFWP